jgi:hypothetical protein
MHSFDSFKKCLFFFFKLTVKQNSHGLCASDDECIDEADTDTNTFECRRCDKLITRFDLESNVHIKSLDKTQCIRKLIKSSARHFRIEKLDDANNSWWSRSSSSSSGSEFKCAQTNRTEDSSLYLNAIPRDFKIEKLYSFILPGGFRIEALPFPRDTRVSAQFEASCPDYLFNIGMSLLCCSLLLCFVLMSYFFYRSLVKTLFRKLIKF